MKNEMSRTFNAKEILFLAEAGKMSNNELRQAIGAAIDFGRQDAALQLQAMLEQQSGLRLTPTDKENSLTNAWLAAGAKSVKNIQYSWSTIADDGVPTKAICPRGIGAHLPTLRAADDPGGCLSHDRSARNRGRHLHQGRQSLIPCDGITEYLRNGGKLEIAQQMANHESARTTKLYDRRNDQVSLEEVERIVI
jgi:hypothetical protein